MNPPENPIAAVTHPDPYPYYASLVAERPVYFDEAIRMWVVSSAAGVEAALANPHGRVRPLGEPVPAGSEGSAVAELFRRLVRQTDGPASAALKRAIGSTLASVDAEHVRALTRECLLSSRGNEGSALHPLSLPVTVLGRLLGIPAVDVIAVDDLARSFAPNAGSEILSRGNRAIANLSAAITNDNGLRQRAYREGIEDVDAIHANTIGLLTQTYEATAGLIGNTLVALARQPDLARFAAPDLVREVARYDSPVQNTRRYLADDAEILGVRMRKGDGILLVLAAANRDPEANANPHDFIVARERMRLYTFGGGVHECPGQTLAVAIASAAIAYAIENHLVPINQSVSYRPSANVRIPHSLTPLSATNIPTSTTSPASRL